MTDKSINIKIQSHPENLSKIRQTVSKALSKCCLSKEDSGSIILAVDEACSNIIRHSYKNDHTKEIELTICTEPDCLSIVVQDKGIEFDINCIEKRDVSEVKPGGLGIYIIQNIMDTVEYSRTKDGCNKLSMIKKITK